MYTQNMGKIGLVLSGGGARGFYHLGLLMGLQSLQTKIDCIAGCSIGAMIGTMYAKDPNINLEEVIREINFSEILKTLILGRKPTNVAELVMYVKKFVKANRFEELKIPTKFNATDLNNRNEVVFSEGLLFPGLIASMALPAVFSPVEFQGNFLVDGGLINNVPISLIANEADTLIVSDITAPVKKIDQKSTSSDILYSSIAFLQQQNIAEKTGVIKDKNVINLRLVEDETFLLDFRQQNTQKLVTMGYEAVMNNRYQILSASS